MDQCSFHHPNAGDFLSLFACRCISGDFIAHASYRVTGNSVAMGEAAGAVAALAAEKKIWPHEIGWSDAAQALEKLRARM